MTRTRMSEMAGGLGRVLRADAVAGAVLLVVTAVALVWANSG